MSLSYTSYYGTKGELVKAYNLVEPFTVNDLFVTHNNSSNPTALSTADSNAQVSEWLGDTWENIFNETMSHPNGITTQLANTLDSEIEFDSGEYKVKLQLRNASRPNEMIFGTQPDTRRGGRILLTTEAGVGTNYGSFYYLKEGEDQELERDSATAIYGPIDAQGFVGNDRYSGNNYAAPVIVRDYTGEVFILTLGVNVTGTGVRNRLEGIAANRIVRLPEYMNREFWAGISNDIPDQEEGVGIVDINNRFAPRVGMNGLGVYPIAKEELQDFIRELWNETFADKLLKFVNGDVMNNIVSLRWFYGIGGSIPRTEVDVYLRLGNQSMSGQLSTKPVIARAATSELMTYSMGSLLVPRKYNNFLDLSPFTKLQVFVPYVGFVNLDMTEFAGRRLRLDYNINIVSGAAIAYIYVQNNDGSWRIAYEQATTMGVEIPLSINSTENLATRMVTAIAGTSLTAGAAFVGSVAGPGGALAAGALGAGFSSQVLGGTATVASNAIGGLSGSFSGTPASRNGGGIDNETGSLGDFQPSIIITRPIALAPSDYNMQVGLPDNSSGTVGSFNGYIKAGAIKQSAVSGLPRQVIDEISQMLRAGVYTQ